MSGAFLVVRAADEDALEEMLSTLPLHPYIEKKITALRGGA